MEKYARALGVKGERHAIGKEKKIQPPFTRICRFKRISMPLPVPPTSCLRRVLPVLRDAAAAAHQHARAGPVQRAESGGDDLHAPDGQRPLRQRHAGAEGDAAAHAARVPQHQHGAEHQHHAGGAGGPLLRHGQEVSAGKYRGHSWLKCFLLPSH